MFSADFDNYVCIGDSITCEMDGFTFTARIEYDSDARPADFDCYSERKINEWRRDKWWFGCIVISAEFSGVDMGDHLAVLGGLEVNYNKQANKYLKVAANEILAEAYTNACEAKRDILERLAL